MTATDPTLIHAAFVLSGNLLFAVTAMVIVFGLLVVGLSFKGPQKN